MYIVHTYKASDKCLCIMVYTLHINMQTFKAGDFSIFNSIANVNLKMTTKWSKTFIFCK